MKRLVLFFLLLVIAAVSSQAAFAAGDKNRGDKGKGNTNQHQVRK